MLDETPPIVRECNTLQPLPPLTLTPTSALIAELKSRYPTGLVVLSISNSRTDTIQFHYTGSVWEAVGMCQRTADFLRHR